ncbi:DUF397 domain-containing protein [Saccharothrix sp. Mg75]
MAFASEDLIGVRDSKNTAPQLAFTPAAWRAFTRAAPLRA